MKLRTHHDYDYSALSSQVASSSDEDLRAGYPVFQAALKSAERRKFVEAGAVEFADELAGNPHSTAVLRELLQDEFTTASDAAAKLKPAPAPPAGTGGGRTWLQWVIVWVSVLTAAHVWLGLDLNDFWSQYKYGGRWGLDGYLYPALAYHRSELAFVTLVIGAMLLWQNSARHPKIGILVRSLGALSTRALVVACLVVLLFLVTLHFRGNKPRARSFGSFRSNAFTAPPGKW
jgi:hypothetical protein